MTAFWQQDVPKDQYSQFIVDVEVDVDDDHADNNQNIDGGEVAQQNVPILMQQSEAPSTALRPFVAQSSVLLAKNNMLDALDALLTKQVAVALPTTTGDAERSSNVALFGRSREETRSQATEELLAVLRQETDADIGFDDDDEEHLFDPNSNISNANANDSSSSKHNKRKNRNSSSSRQTNNNNSNNNDKANKNNIDDEDNDVDNDDDDDDDLSDGDEEDVKASKKQREERSKLIHIADDDDDNNNNNANDESSGEDDEPTPQPGQLAQLERLEKLANRLPPDRADAAKAADPFYNANEDEDNESWLLEVYNRPATAAAQQQQQGRGSRKNNKLLKQQQQLAKMHAFQSDATLSCPGCFTAICYESTRESDTQYRYRLLSSFNFDNDERYYDDGDDDNQLTIVLFSSYSASRVVNCRINNELLRSNNNNNDDTTSTSTATIATIQQQSIVDDIATPVAKPIPLSIAPTHSPLRSVVCALCNTEVGLYDSATARYQLFHCLPGD